MSPPAGGAGCHVFRGEGRPGTSCDAPGVLIPRP